MSDKKKEGDGFKLDAKQFKTGNLLVDIAIGKMVDAINKLDMNKDGKSDLAQFAPILLAAVPILFALSQAIDWKVFRAQLVAMGAIKDKQQFITLEDQLKLLTDRAAELAPKELIAAATDEL